MKRSKISYCDYSGGDLNFVTGCTPVSAGCANCYARAIYERFGRDFSQVRTHPDKLERLRKAGFSQENNVRGPHARPLCFVCDTGDLFHEHVPAGFITYAFEVMESRDDVVWQVLTKRAKRMVDVLFGEEGGWFLGGGDYIENVWLGVTAENQAMADARIPVLLDNWTGVTWVSVEPMLELVDLRPWLYAHVDRPNERLDWVVAGAESGPNRRSFDLRWAASLKRQCATAGVSFFGKQSSGLRPGVPLVIEGSEWKAWPR